MAERIKGAANDTEEGEKMKIQRAECCKNCIFCRIHERKYFVCVRKGSVVGDVEIKNCDRLFQRRPEDVVWGKP